MSINIGPATGDELRPRITVIGVGGAGGNAIANMIESQIEGVDFIVANTDAQALNSAAAENRIQLGPDITGGLGAGARPEVGKAAAEETVQDIEDALEGVNMCFIAAGMGAAPTGAVPVIAERTAQGCADRRRGNQAVPVRRHAPHARGRRDRRIAEACRYADCHSQPEPVLVAKAETTFKRLHARRRGAATGRALHHRPDGHAGPHQSRLRRVKSVMEEMGKAMMVRARARARRAGSRRTCHRQPAARRGQHDRRQGGHHLDPRRRGYETARGRRGSQPSRLVDEDANIILGSAFNPDLDGKIRISVVATGTEQGEAGSAASCSACPSAAGAPTPCSNCPTKRTRSPRISTP